MHVRFVAAFAAGFLAITTAAQAQHVLDNGRLHIVFADPGTGLSTADSDRVDSIAWIQSNGVSTGNLAANGGPGHCNDPQEFFGEAYGEGGAGRPYLVIAGDTAKWTGKTALKGVTKVLTSKVCDNTFDGVTASAYTLTKSAARVNQLTVTRTFTFKAANTSGNLRAYVPRLPLGSYASVFWPNAAGIIQTGNAGGCSGGCEIDDWNGTWFAEQNAAGQGLVVIRNPAKALPAVLLFDNDSFSNSNNSAVALKLPSGGWLGKFSETENLCFFDSITWPASVQAKGKLPKGCTAP